MLVWIAGRGRQPEGCYHRQMIDAVRYLVDNGIKWRAMPCDFPPWPQVYAFFARWRDSGLVAELHDWLREAVRRSEGRKEEPTADVVDSQSVKADATVNHVSRGFDTGKRINGRKRHLHRHQRDRHPVVDDHAREPPPGRPAPARSGVGA
ncbi:transposase [Streptomyces atacamensis]|uniref:transposase n=1 Tax=Streptomyces atacamensis TaxID=531966 RepID=UPI00399D332A